MPVMNGFEFIEHLKQKNYSIPIIVLTSRYLSDVEYANLHPYVETILTKEQFKQQDLIYSNISKRILLQS